MERLVVLALSGLVALVVSLAAVTATAQPGDEPGPAALDPGYRNGLVAGQEAEANADVRVDGGSRAGRGFRLAVEFAWEADLRGLEPVSATYQPGAIVGGVLAGSWVLPWLALDVGLHGGQLRASDESLTQERKTALFVSTGLTLTLPTRVRPYLGGRVGYHYLQSRWETNPAFGSGAYPPGLDVDDRVHSLLVRAEGGLAFEASRGVSVRLGAFVDWEPARRIQRIGAVPLPLPAHDGSAPAGWGLVAGVDARF